MFGWFRKFMKIVAAFMVAQTILTVFYVIILVIGYRMNAFPEGKDPVRAFNASMREFILKPECKPMCVLW